MTIREHFKLKKQLIEFVKKYGNVDGAWKENVCELIPEYKERGIVRFHAGAVKKRFGIITEISFLIRTNYKQSLEEVDIYYKMFRKMKSRVLTNISVYYDDIEVFEDGAPSLMEYKDSYAVSSKYIDLLRYELDELVEQIDEGLKDTKRYSSKEVFEEVRKRLDTNN